MNSVVLVMKFIIDSILTIIALVSIVLFVRFRWPAVGMWVLKIFASALSVVFIFIGVLSFLSGLATGTMYNLVLGAFVTFVYSLHTIRITCPPAPESGFEKAFGKGWEACIKPEQKEYFLSTRKVLKLPVVPKPRHLQNISFAIIPGTDRELLCDIWQPPTAIKPSGLAYIYMHGGAFYIMDKDFGTRPFFMHLAAQGHVIMDVAYRMAPETDLAGMIHDVKRAIAWMKENAACFGVDPDQIIVGGASTGGFLALMAAYTDYPDLTPLELQRRDTKCVGVIAEYPPSDLEALYYHTNQHLTTRSHPVKPKKKISLRIPAWIKKRFAKDFHRLGIDKELNNIGEIAPLVGGLPDECPERYKLFSPVTHVNSKCPPTLLIHGEHDIMAPVKSTRVLYDHLVKANVPTVLHILPYTDHAFNRFLPIISPAAHNVVYDVERFIAVTAGRKHLQPA